MILYCVYASRYSGADQSQRDIICRDIPDAVKWLMIHERGSQVMRIDTDLPRYAIGHSVVLARLGDVGPYEDGVDYDQLVEHAMRREFEYEMRLGEASDL